MRPPTIIDRGRGPELAGTRITVFDIIPYLRRGWCQASIAILFGLSSVQVLALIRYLEEHRDEVMAENAKIEERIARGNPPEIEARLADSPIRARLRARLAEVLRKLPPESDDAGEPDSPFIVDLR